MTLLSCFSTLWCQGLECSKKQPTCLYLKEKKGFVYTIPDRFCAASEIIPDRSSVYTQERLWRRDFCSRRSLKWRVTYCITVHIMNIAKVSLYFRWIKIVFITYIVSRLWKFKTCLNSKSKRWQQLLEEEQLSKTKHGTRYFNQKFLLTFSRLKRFKNLATGRILCIEFLFAVFGVGQLECLKSSFCNSPHKKVKLKMMDEQTDRLTRPRFKTFSEKHLVQASWFLPF